MEYKEIPGEEIRKSFLLTILDIRIDVFVPDTGKTIKGFLVPNSQKVNYSASWLEQVSTNRILMYVCIRQLAANHGAMVEPFVIGIITEPVTDSHSVEGFTLKSEFTFLGKPRQVWIYDAWAERVRIENPQAQDLAMDSIVGYEDDEQQIPVRVYDIIPELKQDFLNSQPKQVPKEDPKREFKRRQD